MAAESILMHSKAKNNHYNNASTVFFSCFSRNFPNVFQFLPGISPITVSAQAPCANNERAKLETTLIQNSPMLSVWPLSSFFQFNSALDSRHAKHLRHRLSEPCRRAKVISDEREAFPIAPPAMRLSLLSGHLMAIPGMILCTLPPAFRFATKIGGGPECAPIAEAGCALLRSMARPSPLRQKVLPVCRRVYGLGFRVTSLFSLSLTREISLARTAHYKLSTGATTCLEEGQSISAVGFNTYAPAAPASTRWYANFCSRVLPRQVRSSSLIFLNVLASTNALWIAGSVPYSSSNFRAMRSEMDGMHISWRIQQTSRSASRFLLDSGGVRTPGGRAGVPPAF